MGHEKDWIEEHDNIRQLLVDKNVIGECSMHQGNSFMVTDEGHAYAVVINALNEGQFSASREALMGAVKSILDDVPYDCTGCSG